MKKVIAGLVAGLVVAMALPVGASDTVSTPVEDEKPITLMVNGQEVTLPDAQPRVVDGQVMVPVLAFSEVAGFDVKWDETNRTLTVTTPLKASDGKPTESVPTETPASVKPPLTIEVDGVTYYEHNSVSKFLSASLPDTRIGIGKGVVVIGSTHYQVAEEYADGRAYKDLRPLVQSGIITQEQVDAYYGK